MDADDRTLIAAHLAYELTRNRVTLYSHRHSRHTYTQPQLLACILLASVLKVRLRQFERSLQDHPEICDVLELKRRPHYASLYRARQRIGPQQVHVLVVELHRRIAAEQARTRNEAILDRMHDVLKRSPPPSTP